ncbi:DEAD/DEAH box helicase [Bacillus sp. CGMCC 1.16607]|uniref:DEAD/DEAH box helicase n=1 Tax=Bacillus sp. CGMCC 1.16607 TaxID=3351842 RepID=UPI00362D147D
MSKLNDLYPLAVQHTKRKIYEDIDRYLENKEKPPTFEQYIEDRIHYIDQIWMNVWLNETNNKVSKSDKKQFLSEKGFETEGIERKLIQSLFRTEMRTYQPFQVQEWLKQTFSNQEGKWLERYEQARHYFFNREFEEQILEKREKLLEELEDWAIDFINEKVEDFYLYVRSFIAYRLREDFKNKTKYQKVDTFALELKLVEQGAFQLESYATMTDFLEELTGEIHKTFHFGRSYFEYETYYYAYERAIYEYVKELVSGLILLELPVELVNQYHELFDESLTELQLKELLEDPLIDLFDHVFPKIQEEYLSDLIRLSDIPFDMDLHKEIYEQDLAAWAKRKMEELAELERKREEEARMMADIFGREYSSSYGKNIRYVLHIGETNTGKTHHALEKMKEAESGLYLAPLRLLALEVYDKLNAEGTPCSLKTGEEEKVVHNAQHISCTVEMFHEKDFYEVIVIDEAQMITDKDRGFSWYKAITKANANEVHIIGSKNAKSMMLKLLGDSNIEIHEYRRETPLEVEPKDFNMNDVKKGDALICFSRKRVLENAARLQRSGHSVSMIYGSMPPETRQKQVQLFIKGETKVIVSTDAIGMGLNLPIRRIVFLENDKFDGTKRRTLTSQEVKQIAGRAGRKGIYNVGKVAFFSDNKKMKELLEKEDVPVHQFAIAPTTGVFDRFQKYYRDLGTFFELWEEFESPKGTKKASLSEERELYKLIRGTDIEGRLSLADLYGFLHMPFSSKEPELIEQWKQSMFAIVEGRDLPEPKVKKRNLEDLELTYKAIGLHLLFLYRLGQRTEAIYWERLRASISDDVHESLKTEVKTLTKKCKNCGKKLSLEHSFPICNSCFEARSRRRYDDYEGWN